MMTCQKCNRLLKITRDLRDVIKDIRCPKHGLDYMGHPYRREIIKKYSGRSKSPHKFGDYQ